ncbi:MAG: FtsX-like permease family protein [[Clostridium] nexile]
MLYRMAVIVILIIIFTSVFVIKNSFDISIMERIKQYGMLASIGATSKQIRKNVLFEELCLE